MAAGVVEISHPNHNSILFETLQNFALNEKFTDLCFVCAKNKKVYTHKLLLCSVSDSMKKIVMEIPETSEMITVHIPDVKKATVSLVVNFLYNGSMRLSEEQYQDFQETVKLLGIVLTVNDKQSNSAQQPTLQQHVYPPPVNMQQAIPGAPQVQSDSQYLYISGEDNGQGMQYIIPEQTQYTTIPQPGDGMMAVQEPIQAVPVNMQDIRQVQPRNSLQGRNHNVIPNQTMPRNSNVQMPQVQQEQYQAPHRNNQISQRGLQSVQYGMGQNVSRRGNAYNVPNQQALSNTSTRIQNNQNPSVLARASTSSGVRRRRQIQQPPVHQMEVPNSSAKRSRNS